MRLTATTAEFDVWIADHYQELKEEIGSRGFLDEDIFHDTYLALLDALTPDIGVRHYQRLFKATYRELRRKELSASYRMVTPSDIFFKLLADDAPQEEEAQQPRVRVSAEEVKTYAAKTFKKSDFVIFQLRYFNDMSLSAIGDYIGRSAGNICVRDAYIRERLRFHFVS